MKYCEVLVRKLNAIIETFWKWNAKIFVQNVYDKRVKKAIFISSLNIIIIIKIWRRENKHFVTKSIKADQNISITRPKSDVNEEACNAWIQWLYFLRIKIDCLKKKNKKRRISKNHVIKYILIRCLPFFHPLISFYRITLFPGYFCV